ncbi:DNA/RNA helicase domain-containing protein [Amnibacterium flavum]|nr:DNA/RNA helicase domain-containing protein [Amnibacterium flavum]
MRQHLANPRKSSFEAVRVVLDNTYNKSVCLDLEAFLINALNGDGRLNVTNLNAGIVDRDYYDRERYRRSFLDVFEQLRAAGVFDRRIKEIENSDLFKLSPFKALNADQAVAIEGILEALFEDVEKGSAGPIVVQGDPGTGKTIVGVTLAKLLQDIKRADEADVIDGDSLFSDFFTKGYADQIAGYRIGVVVPQQSLRASIKRVFRNTLGLQADMVLSPFEVGASENFYDILIVDESHRLNRRSNQPSARLNQRFREINERLFGSDDVAWTQLDWIRARSQHQILLLDAGQRVKPADLPEDALQHVVAIARHEDRHFPLASQMRVLAGQDYIDYVGRILHGAQPSRVDFPGYDLRFFNDFGQMHDEIRLRDAEHGLARLVAGFAWEWRSRRSKDLFDIEIDGRKLRWNQTDKDWISSETSLEEVGSIHTVQGYDLNYAGVIIGPDLRFDTGAGRLYIDRNSYFDKKGKENNSALGITVTDDDLLEFIAAVYFVLLTRGMRGTYLYVHDLALGDHMRKFFPAAR